MNILNWGKYIFKRFLYLVKGHKKYNYLINMILMSYLEEVLEKVKLEISKLDEEAIRSSDFIKDLHEKYILDNIELDDSPVITDTFQNYNNIDVPNMYCQISPKGKVQIFEFEYKIIDGYMDLKKIHKHINPINREFGNNVDTYISLDHLKFTYTNWCKHNPDIVEKKGQIIFDDIIALIENVSNEINYSYNFSNNVTQYANMQLRKLKP